jgi:tetrathionate reductase subunit B
VSQQPPKVSRLQFLKQAGQSAVLLGAGAAGYALWTKATSAIVSPKPAGGKGDGKSPYYSMGIDIEKCIGCGKCVEACAAENNVPPEHFRTWIEQYTVDKDGQVSISSPEGGINGFPDAEPGANYEKAFFVPKLCNHCEDSPCTQVCPVGATFKTDEGVVVIDYDWCVGCRYCIQACPYGSRFWNPVKHTADKCTLCYHRIKKGMQPACVEVCPVGARVFGDLNDPESPISKFKRENAVMTLKPHLRTGAKIVYKGLTQEVI